MNISEYILEYLKKYRRIDVSGFGTFFLENSKAMIDPQNGSILPPSGKIAFSPDFELKSDVLAKYISEKRKISLEQSVNDLEIQTDFWKKKLQADQHLEIPLLGEIRLGDQEMPFFGKRLEVEFPDFYGLEEIKFSEIQNTNTSQLNSKKSNKEDYKFNKSLLWVFLVVVPVLGIAYFGFTNSELLFGKKSFNDYSAQTKTKRIEDVAPIAIDSTLIKKQDSLRLDSLRIDSLKSKTKPKTNYKRKWKK